MAALLALLVLLSAGAVADATNPNAPPTGAAPKCRCRQVQTADAACWPAPAEWAALNQSIHGHLVLVNDELQSCLAKGANSTECAAELSQTDDEFFYTHQVGGFMHTGLAAGGGQEPWSIAHKQSAFAVAAASAADVQAGVAFAAKHNVRVSVKGTGHDWFGRSGSHPDLEGGLLIWTHPMKQATWHAGAFVAEGCAAASGVEDAVTLQAGLQFADFYPEAEKRGRLVNGGTCTSVGVGGCTMGGCFGPFSQKLGPAASNVLEAKVVLADGSLVTASKCSHPDLFWALRGGGAGWGVVTEWTMRTYPSPKSIDGFHFSGKVESDKAEDIMAVAVEVLRAADVMLEARQGWNTGISLPNAKSSGFSISGSTADGNATEAEPLFAAFDKWIKAQPASMKVSGEFGIESRPKPASGWIKPGAPEGQVSLPWDDPHHDTEIGTEHLVSMSKWMTRTAINEGPGDTGKIKMATALMNFSAATCSGPLSGALCKNSMSLGGSKSQGDANAATVALFKETSQNPVLLDAVGAIFSQWRVPALPQLPPSAALVKTLWKRLPHYGGIEKTDPLYALCEAGQTDEAKAKDCLAQWAIKREALVAQLVVAKATLNYHFPTDVLDGKSYSGSYWNEADYYEPHWQRSFFGTNYPKLLEVKKKYDPEGFFTCHHCVGSELRSEDGNCAL